MSLCSGMESVPMVICNIKQHNEVKSGHTLDLRHLLEVHFGRKGFGYLKIRERPINLYSVLSSYWNTKS